MMYVYRLDGGGPKALAARGLGALVDDGNEHYKNFIAHTPENTLYVPIGPVQNPKLFADGCFNNLRRYSSMNNLNITYVKRLLTVRNDWSRK